MRTTATCALLFSGLALVRSVANFAKFDFDKNLQCGGCIRGGYVFCGKSGASQCVEQGDQTTIQALQNDKYTCSVKINPDKAYGAFEICAIYNNANCATKGF